MKILPFVLLCSLFALPAAAADEVMTVPGWEAYQQGDMSSARAQFELAARQGDRVAAYNLAMMHWRKEGGLSDRKAGLRWLQQAADAGLAQAEHALGVLYESGDTVSRSLPQATFWFDRAANHGLTVAQIDLATQFYLGRGAPQDNSRAAYWYLRAAEQGDAGAQYLIASMYEKGLGVRLDIEQAIRWYAKAGVQGDVAASMKAIELAKRISPAL